MINIEDNFYNIIWFLIVGREYVFVFGEDKILVIVFMKNKLGVFYEFLVLFYDVGIMLIWVEIRFFCDGIWIYLFFIDFEGYEFDV